MMMDTKLNGFQKTSVVICAYTEKRWDDTLEAIASLFYSDAPPLEVVLVIDHNPDLFHRFLQHFDGVDVVTVIENQNIRGLSGARNSGINVCKGELIGFLDDDAVADPDWVARLAAWCVENENVLGAGSKVDPIWVDREAAWFPAEFYWTVGCSYLGLPEASTEVRNPFGGSMVVKKSMFDLVGGFRTGTGRVGEIPLGCEETELSIRARQQRPEMKFIYDPNARIRHKVPGGRLTWSYFLARCYNEGLSKALLAKLVGAQDSLSAEKSYTFSVLPKGVLKGLADFLFRFDPGGLGRAAAITAGLFTTGFGYLVGIIKMTRSRARKKAIIGDINSMPKAPRKNSEV